MRDADRCYYYPRDANVITTGTEEEEFQHRQTEWNFVIFYSIIPVPVPVVYFQVILLYKACLVLAVLATYGRNPAGNLQ